MRPANVHLRPEEFEVLLFGAADSREGQAEGALLADAEQHLSACLVCQSRAEKYRQAENALNVLEAERGRSSRSGPLSRSAECLDEETWRSLAAGLMENGQAARYASHAATCDWCGRLLRESMEDLAQDVTPEERQALSELPIASAKWQSTIAEKLSAQSRSFREKTLPNLPISWTIQKSASPARKSILRGWNLAWAGAGLALVFAVFWFAWWRTKTSEVNALLAQAYTQQRKIELRMPWAGYGALVAERGNEKQDLPGQFYTAQGIIKTELGAHPNDSVWLQAQARAHLLEWKYEKALQELNEALSARPDDPMLLQDRVTAFFEQAEKGGTQSHIYYGDAVEDLSKILKANPDDAVALFNRAILYEKLQLPQLAIPDLKKYLSLDPTGPWAEEARIRLQRLESLKKAHDDASEEPLVDSAAFLRFMGDPSSVVHVDERIESYQDQAIQLWLPQAFPVSGPSNTEAFSALRALAGLLAEHHQDMWLNNLLDTAHASPAFASAIAELSEALSATAQGEASKASVRAAQAAQLFHATGNRAGALRAEAEEVHGFRNSQQGNECLLRANLLTKELAGRNNAWIQGQFEADWCSCLLMAGKFEQARVHTLRALDASSKSSYPILQMRSLGIDASIETDEGNILAAWAKDQEGLSKYWQSKYAPPLRAQQFYDDLTYSAENAGNLELALAFSGESVRMSLLSKDKNFEALARQHLAKIAERTGRLSLASEEMEKSSTLLGPLSSQPGMETNGIYALAGIAEIEVERGQVEQAQKSLESIRSKLGQVHSFTVSRAFYKAYGELQLKENKLDAAEEALQKAIDEADGYLKKLDRASDRYFWIQENSGLYRTFVQLELKKGSPEKALVAWEWYRTAFDRSLTGSISLKKLLQESAPFPLPPSSLRHQATLVYSLFPGSLAIWIIDEKGINNPLVVPVDSERLKDSARKFLEMCGNPDSNLENLKAAGQSLFQTLLGPVGYSLSGKTGLVIELDEELGDIPFDALVAPNHQYAGEMYEIAFSPGLLYGKNPRQVRSISRDSRLLAVGSTANIASPEFSLDPLIDTPQEAENVARLFPKSTLLKEPNATVQSMEAALPQAEIFHFAGHAISGLRIEGLVIADQREKENATVWDAAHIRAALVQNVQLAVLSACATGKSYKGRREAHGELVRAFLLAGVSNVVGSRWNVSSYRTGQLMEKFYAAVASGHSISSSMQIAASEMRSRPETRHPYYWAPFGVFGRT